MEIHSQTETVMSTWVGTTKMEKSKAVIGLFFAVLFFIAGATAGTGGSLVIGALMAWWLSAPARRLNT